MQKELKRARVYATCHGAYQLSVNGIRPDDRELAPEFTAYEKYLCYQTYDISSLLRAGTNAIDRKSTRLNSSHVALSRMPPSA